MNPTSRLEADRLADAFATTQRTDMPRSYSPPLDPCIEPMVETLQAAGIGTFESCEGGPGHAYPEPTVRFHGERSEGFRALAAAQAAGHSVAELRRVWPINDGEPTGPWWELTFSEHANIGRNVTIGKNATIDRDTTIGPDA